MTNNRVRVAFSCGDASAIAAKEAIADYGDRCSVYYCDTFAFEHPDNRRFFAEVQEWLGRPIEVLRSEDYTDIFDVFEKTRWLVGVGGARCTTELKKMVRITHQLPDDLHVFGFTSEEGHRVDRFNRENPDLQADMILHRKGITKAMCHQRIREAGIELPAMYRLGYKNNNCIGCVKGQSGYWNKIRVDFPEAFARMASMERKLDAAICKKESSHECEFCLGTGRVVGADAQLLLDYPDDFICSSCKGRGRIRTRARVFLDELPPDAGRYDPEPDIECGVLCIHENVLQTETV